MKKLLEITIKNLYHYNKNGKKIDGKNDLMRGNCSGLSGDCSGLSGNCSGLSGDCSGLSGDCSGLSGNCSGLSGDCSGLIGNCTGLRGDLDDCEITDKEREKGIIVDDLIK